MRAFPCEELPRLLPRDDELDFEQCCSRTKWENDILARFTANFFGDFITVNAQDILKSLAVKGILQHQIMWGMQAMVKISGVITLTSTDTTVVTGSKCFKAGATFTTTTVEDCAFPKSKHYQK
ncbi:hypothetical protein BD408DRAFT_439502 [Parasitella parasitica]|nr:hypothetical protein BD408DRAFT_439502 [Parasitella parasitica]